MKRPIKSYLPIFHTNHWYWIPTKERVYADINSWNWLCFEYLIIPDYYYENQ